MGGSPQHHEPHHELDKGTVGIFTKASKIAAYWVHTTAESGYEFYYLSKVNDATYVVWSTSLAGGPYTLTKDTSLPSNNIAAFEAAIGYTPAKFTKAVHQIV